MKTVKFHPVFDKWFSDLKDREAFARITVRIRRLGHGNPGQLRNLKAGVSEMKIDFGAGYRVYFTERAGEIVVLLCGGTKKTQSADIARAEQLAKEL